MNIIIIIKTGILIILPESNLPECLELGWLTTLVSISELVIFITDISVHNIGLFAYRCTSIYSGVHSIDF